MWLSLSSQAELGEFWSLMQEAGTAKLLSRMESSKVFYFLFRTVVGE